MTRKHALGAVLAGLIAGALLFAPAASAARLWTDSTETTPLREVASVPKNQPDAMEFENLGPVVVAVMRKGFINPIECNEVELGTTVVVNNTVESRLAMPFGVAEGDECTGKNASGATENVPTYFDT